MDCKKAVELYLLEESSKEQKEAALDHFVSCPKCTRNFRGFILALQGKNPIPCAECSDRIPEYIVATPWERTEKRRLREVTKHLKVCPDCYQEFDEVEKMCRSAAEYLRRREEKKKRKARRKELVRRAVEATRPA